MDRTALPGWMLEFGSRIRGGSGPAGRPADGHRGGRGWLVGVEPAPLGVGYRASPPAVTLPAVGAGATCIGARRDSPDHCCSMTNRHRTTLPQPPIAP